MADDEKGDGNYEYTPPDFDEDEFIRKEMTGFKASLILFILGVILAIASVAIFRAMDGGKTAWLTTVAVWGLGVVSLKVIYDKFNVDVSHYGKAQWFGAGFMLFITWISIFILALNPPIGDDSEPRVDLFLSPPVQELGGDLRIDIIATDNDQIANLEMRLTGPSFNMDESSLQGTDGHRYISLDGADLAAGTYTVNATVTDASGLVTQMEQKIHLTQNAITYTPPANDQITGPSQYAHVTLPETFVTCDRSTYAQAFCVRLVAFDVQREEGTSTVLLERDEDHPTRWRADSDQKGWQHGENTFTIRIESASIYHGPQRIDGVTIVSPGEETITIADNVGLGNKQVEVLEDPSSPPPRNVPGIGVVALLVGLVAIAVIVRKRK